MSSGLFTTFLSLGQTVGPLSGSYITQGLGFRLMTDTIAIGLLFFFVLYFCLCDGFGELKRGCKRSKKEKAENVLMTPG